MAGQQDGATPVKPTFEECAPEIQVIIGRRRSSWTYISIMEWQDVSAILLEHVWKKWELYDPLKAPKLEHWVNTVITRALLNLRRDSILRYSRPCIGGGASNGKSCVYNLGGDACSFTKSGKQCAECPLYRDWQKTRQHQLHVKSNVALEHHTQEVHNIQGDFTDADEIKSKIDGLMRKELNHWEWRIYEMLYIEHVKPATISEHLEALVKTWKRAPRADERFDYQSILAEQRRFKAMMIDLLKREGHL